MSSALERNHINKYIYFLIIMHLFVFFGLLFLFRLLDFNFLLFFNFLPFLLSSLVLTGFFFLTLSFFLYRFLYFYWRWLFFFLNFLLFLFLLAVLSRFLRNKILIFFSYSCPPYQNNLMSYDFHVLQNFLPLTDFVQISFVQSLINLLFPFVFVD